MVDTGYVCQKKNILPRGQNIKKRRGDVVARNPETHNLALFLSCKAESKILIN
jgi:hypothetical protein